MFDSEEFKKYFGEIFGEFSKLSKEFEDKKDIYPDIWQFLLAKAAKELGIIPADEERVLTSEEINELYTKAFSFMPSFPLDKESQKGESAKPEEEPLKKDLEPGKLPRPPWFNIEPPEDEKK